VLTGLPEVPVCVAYEVDGKRHDELPTNQAELARAVPVYETFPGWTEDISAARTLDDLPTDCRDYVDALEKMIKAPISAVGVGPGRDEVIAIRDLLAG
jgi:adenylosuccinate synthase